MEEQAVTTFGKVLRQERNRKGMNQTQLGELVGTTQQNIGHWEAGRTMPKQESYEKLLEIFGDDSPLSYLPPRDEIRLEAKAIAQASSKAVLDVKPSTAALYPPEVKFATAATAASRRANLLSSLEDDLPPHLRSYLDKPLEYMGFTYFADYISPALCVKVYTPQDERNVLISARLGMQTMLMLKAALNDVEPGKERTYLLCIVSVQSASRWVGGAWKRIDTEAEALGLTPCFSSDLHGIAAVITHIEEVGIAKFMAEVDDVGEADY
jgi:transcriptional regulator with XRE-family HTH domain